VVLTGHLQTAARLAEAKPVFGVFVVLLVRYSLNEPAYGERYQFRKKVSTEQQYCVVLLGMAFCDEQRLALPWEVRGIGRGCVCQTVVSEKDVYH
jgi:hypothetical protein